MSEERNARDGDEARRIQEGENEIDVLVLFAGILKKFKAHWWVVLVPAILVALALGGYKYLTYRPMYRVTATFTVNRRLLTSTGNDSYGYSYDYGTVSQLTDTFPFLVSSDLLTDVIADEMGTDKVSADIYSSGVEDTNLFSIYVDARDPDYAYQVMQSVIKNYPKVAEYVIGDTQLSMLINPFVPDAPYNDSQALKYLLIGGLAGFVVGMGILFLMAYFNNSVKTVEDISQMLNQTSLGILPHVATRKRRSSGASTVSILSRSTDGGMREAMRSIRTRLLRDMDERGAKVLMVTSSIAGEGKSTIAMNLAITIAQKHASVILVDADLRHSSMVKYLGLRDPQFTYLDVADGKAKIEDALIDSRIEGLKFLPCGSSAAPLEILSSQKFSATIKRLQNMADFVIVDTPPCGMLADASAFAPSCDAALFVIRQDTSTKWQVLDALQAISFTGLPILGCVLNDVSAGLAGYGYGYGYGSYGYGAYGRRHYGYYNPEEKSARTE